MIIEEWDICPNCEHKQRDRYYCTHFELPLDVMVRNGVIITIRCNRCRREHFIEEKYREVN